MQGIQRLEMGKRLSMKYLMEENSNQAKEINMNQRKTRTEKIQEVTVICLTKRY